MSVLIKNGRVVTAVDDCRADVFVEGETVALIGHGLERGLEVAADRIIDATGKLLLPGGIDPHTHMELPFGGTESSDTFETGTRAAAFGGTTSIVDFAVQTRGASTIITTGSAPAGSTSTASSSLPPPRRRAFSGCFRARGPSRSGRTRTS